MLWLNKHILSTQSQLGIFERFVKNTWFCHHKHNRKCPKTSLKHPILSPQTMLEMSESVAKKHLVLLPQTQLKMAQSLHENTQFCRYKHDFKCPKVLKVSPKTSGSVTTNPVQKDLKCPKVFLKTPSSVTTNTTWNVPKCPQNTCFCYHKHSWKCPKVSAKTPGSVTTNPVENGPKPTWKHLVLSPQTGLEMSESVLKNTPSCDHKHT